ncbi:MAG: terminase family protein [Candidatus Bathyarchaeia archaeon]
MEEKAFIDRITSDIEYAASECEGLLQRPKALRQLIAHPEVTRKLVEDPVFFAVLMCGDKWLPKAPEHQKLLRDSSPRQIAVCGRGWGKSLVFSRKNLWLLYTKSKIESLIISSTQRQSMIMFDYCYFTIMANPLMREMVLKPGTTRTAIRLKPPLGGKIVALPCSKDRLRGYHPDYVFIDEASIVPGEMITSEIMMMLTKPGASLVMSGTPMGSDHVFRKAFLDTKRYSVHHYASYQSPLVSPAQLDEWKEVMTQEEWEREVEGLWVEATHTFFPMDLIVSCVDPELGNPESAKAYIEDIEKVKEENKLIGPYYAGLDLGKQMDYSVLAVVQKSQNGDIRLVHKRQFPLGTSYPEVIGYVARAEQVFRFERLNVDKGGIGDAVVDELNNINVPSVEGVFFTDAEKENMLNNVKLLMEKKRLKIAGDDKALFVQINEQEYAYLQPKTAQERIHLKFWHPQGKHDDQLMALALACKAAQTAAPPGVGAFIL